ncbi:MAG: hypothetical protein ACLTG0_08040 [Oscillibacter sp.]
MIPMGIEAYGYEIRYWTGDAAVQSGVLLACLAAVAVLARQVFAKAFGSLLQKRCTSELLAVVSAVVMAADCVARLVLPERSAVPCYAPVELPRPGVCHVGPEPGEPGTVGHLPHGRHG